MPFNLRFPKKHILSLWSMPLNLVEWFLTLFQLLWAHCEYLEEKTRLFKTEIEMSTELKIYYETAKRLYMSKQMCRCLDFVSKENLITKYLLLCPQMCNWNQNAKWKPFTIEKINNFWNTFKSFLNKTVLPKSWNSNNKIFLKKVTINGYV